MNTTTITPSKPICNTIDSSNQKKLYYEMSRIIAGWNMLDFIIAGQSSLVLIISICVTLSVWLTQSDGTVKNTLMYTGIFLLVVLIILTIVMCMPPKKTPEIKNYDCIEDKNTKYQILTEYSHGGVALDYFPEE